MNIQKGMRNENTSEINRRRPRLTWDGVIDEILQKKRNKKMWTTFVRNSFIVLLPYTY